ncbi:hypothetical protein TUMSATVNIG3_42090 [Vibrio nigripulchritudo]|nr:hypothetical protein TUMSATVNIG2_41570 [Vibrio nigripulchritudo]BDU45411.1 hypothetical protein TUMSATVNIG3_42090 [Vibrio nigripulchritudo]
MRKEFTSVNNISNKRLYLNYFFTYRLCISKLTGFLFDNIEYLVTYYAYIKVNSRFTRSSYGRT